jgi:hypothetical protein
MHVSQLRLIKSYIAKIYRAAGWSFEVAKLLQRPAAFNVKEN